MNNNNDNNQLALFGANNQLAECLTGDMLHWSDTERDGVVTARSVKVLKKSGKGVSLALKLGLSAKTDKAKLNEEYKKRTDALKGMLGVEVAKIVADAQYTGGSMRKLRSGKVTITFDPVRMDDGSTVSVDKAIAKLVEQGLTVEDITKKIAEAIAKSGEKPTIDVPSESKPAEQAEDKPGELTTDLTPDMLRRVFSEGTDATAVELMNEHYDDAALAALVTKLSNEVSGWKDLGDDDKQIAVIEAMEAELGVKAQQ